MTPVMDMIKVANNDTCTENPTKNPTENPTENLTQLERKIVDVLLKNPSCTQKQLAEEVAVGYSTIREYIVRLRNKGTISRIGSARSGYWTVNRKTQF